MNKKGEVEWQTMVSEQTTFIVKFVLKLFQTYITSVYFLYLCNVLTSIAIPEANSSQQGGGRIGSIVKLINNRRYGFVFS